MSTATSGHCGGYDCSEAWKQSPESGVEPSPGPRLPERATTAPVRTGASNSPSSTAFVSCPKRKFDIGGSHAGPQSTVFPNSCPKWKFGLPDVQLLACASSETTELQWHRLYVAFTAVHPSTRKSHNLPTWVVAELHRAFGPGCSCGAPQQPSHCLAGHLNTGLLAAFCALRASPSPRLSCCR